MATVTNEPTGKKIGATTKGATAGTGLAGAAGVIVVWVLGLCGVEVPPEVAGAIVVLIGGAGTLVGGRISPTDQVRTQVVTAAQPAPIPDPGVAAVPDGTGEHRATEVPEVLEVLEPVETTGSTAVAPDPDPVVTETTVMVQ